MYSYRPRQPSAKLHSHELLIVHKVERQVSGAMLPQLEWQANGSIGRQPARRSGRQNGRCGAIALTSGRAMLPRVWRIH